MGAWWRGKEDPSYLRCLRLAALGCLRFLSGKQQEREEVTGSMCMRVCVCGEGVGQNHLSVKTKCERND